MRKIIKDSRTLPKGWVVVEESWYQVLEKKAKEISDKYGICPLNESGRGITDDDTLHDWLNEYDGDLGRMQKDYPGLKLRDIQDIFSFNEVLQSSVGMGPMGSTFSIRYPMPESEV